MMHSTTLAGIGSLIRTERMSHHLPWIFIFMAFFLCGLSGYGNEGDIYLMIRAGNRVFETLTYVPSRLPGYFLAEITVAALDRLGGYVLINTVASLAGVAILGMFFFLLRQVMEEGQAWLATLFVAVNPIFIVAASSSALDNILAPLFYFGGLCALVRRWHLVAAVLLGLAVGARLNSALIVLSIFLFAIAWHGLRGDLRAALTVLGAGALALVVAGICYVPVIMATGGDFLGYVTADWGFVDHMARFIYKNIYLFGLPFYCAVLLIICLRGCAHVMQRNSDMLGLFLLSAAIVIQGQYAMLPHDVRYLIPFLFIAGVTLARSEHRGVMAGLIACVLTYNFVNVDVLAIEYDPTGAEAIAAEWDLHVEPGYLWQELQHRAAFHESHRDMIVGTPAP